MDYGKAFTFFFEDEDWVRKLLIGSLFAFLGMLTLGLSYAVLYGWAIEISRRNLESDDPALPEFDEIGRYFVEGLKLFLAQLTWVLPMILIWIPVSVIPFFLGSGAVDEELVAAIITLVLFCTMPVALVVGLGLSIALPAQFGLFAATGSFKAVVNPVNLFKLVKANPVDFLLSWLILYGVQMLASLAMMLTCFIGMFPSFVHLYAVLGKLGGDAYRVTMDKAPDLELSLG